MYCISSYKQIFLIHRGSSIPILRGIPRIFHHVFRPQYDEQQKLTRLRCRLLEDLTKEGWVTMKGNQGLEPQRPQRPQCSERLVRQTRRVAG